MGQGLRPLPRQGRTVYGHAADDERFDDAMRGNLDAVSKLPRIDGIDESRIFTVPTNYEGAWRL